MRRCHFLDADNGGHRTGSLTQGPWGLVPLWIQQSSLMDRKLVIFPPSFSIFTLSQYPNSSVSPWYLAFGVEIMIEIKSYWFHCGCGLVFSLSEIKSCKLMFR